MCLLACITLGLCKVTPEYAQLYLTTLMEYVCDQAVILGNESPL